MHVTEGNQTIYFINLILTAVRNEVVSMKTL